MSAILRDGPLDWRLTRDDNGYRTYKLQLLVEVTSSLDGPAVASNCPGLPLPGEPWLIDNDIDIWVWCRSEASVTPIVTTEPNQFFIVEFTFSNKPLTREQAERRRGCHDIQIEDPLLEPDRVSGDFTEKTKEATYDRFGLPIEYSSHEPISGPAVEFEEGWPTIKVVQNVPLLQFDLLCFLINSLNDAPLWGFPTRWVRFANCTWEQQYHGQCYRYYVRILIFKVSDSWDRDIRDYSELVLNGHWGDEGEEGAGWVLDEIEGEAPDPDNPSHFMRAIDRHGNPCRLILDGAGKPATKQAIKITSVALDAPENDHITVTVESEHGLEVGDTVTIIGILPTYMRGAWEVLTVPSTTAFSVDIGQGGTFDWEHIGDTSGGYIYVEGDGKGSIRVEKYPDGNLLTLGVPLTL